MADFKKLFDVFGNKVNIMAVENANSIFMEDDEGVIVITDISENEDMLVGEFVYDGKNIGIFNRNNEKYYALQNIPPSIRENIVKSDEITIIVKDVHADMAAYAVKVRIVEDMGFKDRWEEYANNLTNDLKNLLTEEEFKKLIES